MDESVLRDVQARGRLTFAGKLERLAAWAEGSEERTAVAGLRRLDNGDFQVNVPVLAEHMGIQERSLAKNFALCGFSHLKLNRMDIFTRQNNYNLLQPRNRFALAGVRADPIYDQMFFYWEKFNRSCPERKVGDFVGQFASKKNGWIGVERLIESIIKSQNFDNESFLSVFQHFGPVNSISSKVSIVCASVFSRGWRFDRETRSVRLVDNGGFVFNDGNKRIELYNDLSKSFNERWLRRKDNNQYFELECMFEKMFPKEIQSNVLMREAIEELFSD